MIPNTSTKNIIANDATIWEYIKIFNFLEGFICTNAKKILIRVIDVQNTELYEVAYYFVEIPCKIA